MPDDTASDFLSVVVPAFNESGAVARVLEDLKTALTGLPCQREIIVVDDASRDDTAAIVAATPGVRLLRNPVNLGYGHSLLRGIALARGNLIAICDADGSYDVSALPSLYAQVQAGVDHAIGRRTGPHSERPWMMRTIYRWLCNYVVGVRVPDANSGLRVFRREIADSLRGDLCLGFSFTTSLTLASLMWGYIVSFSDIGYRKRVGRSHVRVRDILRTAQYLFQLVAAYNPIKLFLPLVLLAALLSLGGLTAAALGSNPMVTLAGLVMAATVLILTALAALAYVVSRAAAGPIRGRSIAGASAGEVTEAVPRRRTSA